MKVLYTTKELEEIFKVTRHTLIKWREQGMPFVKIGGTIRYDMDEIKKWIDNQKDGDNK